MKKWLFTCGELSICEDKIKSVTGDTLTKVKISGNMMRTWSF